MRTMFILRGAPGVGNDYWVDQNGLRPYTVSADDIRLLYLQLMQSGCSVGMGQCQQKGGINLRNLPKAGEVWKHFKGKYYLIIEGEVEHTETGEKFVVYRQLYSPFGVYCRPIDMFMSKTDKDKYPEAVQNNRFKRIG